MPTMDISREQAAYIEALREELADQVTYGHVRTQDALQYLIDHHREDGEVDVEVDADIEPDGGAPEAERPAPDDAGGGTDDGDAGAGDGADDAEDGSGGDAGAGDGATTGGGPTRTTSSGPDLADAAAALSGSGPGGSGGDAGEDAGGEPAVDVPDTVGDSGDERVNEMMNLLSTHDDKWSESDGAEGKYEVDLPDDGTERVQTKDDVRALLFRHYR